MPRIVKVGSWEDRGMSVQKVCGRVYKRAIIPGMYIYIYIYIYYSSLEYESQHLLFPVGVGLPKSRNSQKDIQMVHIKHIICLIYMKEPLPNIHHLHL